MYHRHDIFGDEHPGYHSGTDSDDEHHNKYASAKYHLGKDSPLGVGYRSEDQAEHKEREKSEFEKHIDEEHKPKYKKKDDEETLKRKAAEEINKEIIQFNGKEIEHKKKSKSSIEEAIEKAVAEEKKVL